MTSPLGWPGDISQDETFGLDETTGWDESAGAEVVIQAFFGVPAQPTFIWLPDPARIEESVQFRTLVTQFESGREQRRVKGVPRRRWRLQFRKGQVDIDDLWAFYLARRGPVEPFLWEHPVTGQTHLVRFPERLTRRVLWRVLYEVGLELLEVR